MHHLFLCSECEDMIEHLEQIDYKGKQILYFDFTGFFGEKYIQIITEAKEFLLNLHKENLLLLVNISETYADNRILKCYTEIGIQIKSLLDKVAVVGTSKTQDVFLKTVNLMTGVGAKSFSTLEEAKEWLVE
jgi:hypothetical protein